MATFCAEHNIIVISDEVHCDFVYPANTHIPFGSLIGAEKSITVISPSKSFNTAAIPQSSLIMQDASMAGQFQDFLNNNQLNLDNIFGAIAMVASYNDCGPWLDQAIDYVAGNLTLAKSFITNHLPKVKIIEPEGTYILWLDFRGLSMEHEQMNKLFINKGGIGLCSGTDFQTAGFFRMNMACPQSTFIKGLECIKATFSAD